nr:hypothetical protein [Nostoc sp. ChiSLP03a]MDZ8212486.1 hypothetical protein [Nostoc sp. ChiSLP03a]
MTLKTSNHDLAIDASPIGEISLTQQAINLDGVGLSLLMRV